MRHAIFEESGNGQSSTRTLKVFTAPNKKALVGFN
jgi:hypothetical protein